MKAKTNKEGLTLLEWTRAAGLGDSRPVWAVRAWQAGEDPTEYRAEAGQP